MDKLKLSSDLLLKCLHDNFTRISKRHPYPDVIDSFQGKFKPSWESNFGNSALRVVFLKEAKKNNLHHYHIGYKFYQDGFDENYPGKVSDGIIHFRIFFLSHSQTEFRILDICEEHPSPFQIPFNNLTDEAVLEA